MSIRHLKFAVILALTLALPAMTQGNAAIAAGMMADITDPAYGARPDDGKDDTAAIQKAIDNLKPHGELLIPPGAFQVSIAKGLTLSKDHITVIIRGTVKATAKGVARTDAGNIFTVTGNGCKFIGQGGMFVGDGSRISYADIKRGSGKPWVDIPHHAFIYFKDTRDCVVSGLLLRDPPGVHLLLFGARDTRIINCTIEGGTEEIDLYTDMTWHFCAGIIVWRSDRLLVQGNSFRPREGRAQFQWILGAGRRPSRYVSIIGNNFVGAWDHPIYCSGIHHCVVANNITRDTIGTAIKLIGTDMVVVGNKVSNALHSGISARSSSRSIVANNHVQDFGRVGIMITSYHGNKDANTDNIVMGNVIIAHKQTGQWKLPWGVSKYRKEKKLWEWEPRWGILIRSPKECSRCKVTGNIIIGAGGLHKCPAILMRGGQPSDSVTISNNTITDCDGIGIQTQNVHSSLIVDNIVHCAGKPIDTGDGRDIILRDNITSKKQPGSLGAK